MDDVLAGMWGSVQAGWNAGAPEISGHRTLMEDFQASSQHFYTLIEKAIERRKLPELKLSRVQYKEGWMLSASREYLRIQHRNISWEICGAPFGIGFFVSCRMIVMPDGFFTRLKNRIFKPNTFYQMDITAMYQLSVDAAVKEATGLLTKQEVKVLSTPDAPPAPATA